MERRLPLTCRGLRVVMAAAAAMAVAATTASPALADPPPAAAGTTSHGFLARGDVLTKIDHPATVVPATPAGQAGTAILGINDCGEGAPRPGTGALRYRGSGLTVGWASARWSTRS